jgi:hypothetical protein
MGGMNRLEEWRTGLSAAADTITYLRRHSGLPGPRGNLELVQAAADFGSEPDFRTWIAIGSGDDPTDEFLVVCGVVGVGRLAAEGRTDGRTSSARCVKRWPTAGASSLLRHPYWERRAWSSGPRRPTGTSAGY